MIKILLVLPLLLSVDRTEADHLFDQGRWSEARAAYAALLPDAESPEKKAVILERIGVTWLKEGSIWEADTWFERSLEEKESASAWLNRGRVYYTAALESIRTRSPGSEIRALLGDAVSAYGSALGLEADSPEILVALALAHRDLGDVPAERSALEKALAISPGHPDATLELALRLEREGSREEARKLLLDVPAESRTGLHYKWLGYLAAKTGDPKVMRESYRKAALLDPTDQGAFEGVWNATVRRKEHDHFREDMKTVLDRHPGAFLACYFLGLAEKDRKQWKPALEAFRRASGLDPEDLRPRRHAARILLTSLGRAEEGLAAWFDVLSRSPDDETARVSLEMEAGSRSKVFDYATAEKILRALIEADPGQPRHRGNLAVVLREMGRTAEAEAVYVAAEEDFPFEPSLTNDHGLLLMGIGRTEDAYRAFRKALEQDPENLDTLENMGAYARLRGDYDEALDWFRKAYRRALELDVQPWKFRRYLDLVAGEKEASR